MAVTARNTTACQTVLSLAEQRSTARVTVGAGAAEVAVYLLDGHLLGAKANDDTAVLVERLQHKRHLTSERARQLQAMQSMSMPILGRDHVDPILSLLVEEVDPTVFDAILRERFEENVARYVGHRGAPRIEPGVLPWAFNLLVGQETAPMLDRAVRSWDLAQSLEDARLLVAGPIPATDAAQQLVLAALAGGPVSARELAAATGLEPVSGRAAVARMLVAAMLVDAPVEPVRGAESPVDDELEAFSGADDRHRGGQRGGSFVTDRRNLDRVELEPAEGSKEPTYSAPTLSESDAKDKIEVANEVLLVLAQALDTERGGHRGQAVTQILVDGRPRAYIPLFDGIRATASGTLPHGDLIANLRRRPNSEQRRLLNQGLLDLLDRALDRVAEELSEERFDEALSRVMGYRQRMGL